MQPDLVTQFGSSSVKHFSTKKCSLNLESRLFISSFHVFVFCASIMQSYIGQHTIIEWGSISAGGKWPCIFMIQGLTFY